MHTGAEASLHGLTSREQVDERFDGIHEARPYRDATHRPAPARRDTIATMRITTWNIWWKFGPWRERRPAVLRTLRELESDIICLQEVALDPGDNHAVELAGALGLFAAVPENDDASLGNAILSRWPIDSTETIPLPSRTGDDGPRTLLLARVDAPVGAMLVANTHLAYRFDESALRRTQLEHICALIAERRNDAETVFPPILCGDLNAVPTSDEIRMLTGESPPPVPGLVFTDAWAAVGEGPGDTWDARNPHLSDTSWPRRRLDYILVAWPRPKPLGNPQHARLAGAGRAEGGPWPSDHLALCVDICAESGPASG